MTLACIFFICSAMIAGWYLVARIGGQVSVSLLLFGSLLAIHGVPLLVYLYVRGPGTGIFEAALSSTNRETIIDRLLIALGLMFLMITVGSAFARVALASWVAQGLRMRHEFRAGQFRRVYRLTPPVALALSLVVVCMGIVSVTEGQFSKVIDYFVIDATAVARILLRIDSGGTPYYLYNVVLYSVAPFLVMVAGSIAYLGRRSLGAWYIAGGLFIVVLLGKFGTLSKAPPVIFILQLLLFRSLLLGEKLNLRMVGGMLVSALVLLAIIVQLTFPEIGMGGTLNFLYYRVFDIPNEGLIEYFAAIPAILPHHWSVANLAEYFGGGPANPIPTYSAVAAITRGNYLSTSNVMFLGDAWADFSWAGVLIYSFVAGALVRAIDIYAGRSGPSDEWACLVAGGAFGVFTLLSTALNTAMVTGGLVLMPILSALLVGLGHLRTDMQHRSEMQ